MRSQMPFSRSLFWFPPLPLLLPLSGMHLRHSAGTGFSSCLLIFFFNLKVLNLNSSSTCSLMELFPLYSHYDLSQIQANKSSQEFDRSDMDFSQAVFSVFRCPSHNIAWYTAFPEIIVLFQSEMNQWWHCHNLLFPWFMYYKALKIKCILNI